MPETRCTECHERLKTGADNNVWWRTVMPAGTKVPICAACWSRGQVRTAEADAAELVAADPQREP